MLHLLIDAHVLISHDQEHQVSLPVESVQACTEENIVIPLESHWMIKLWTFDCISFHYSIGGLTILPQHLHKGSEAQIT